MTLPNSQILARIARTISGAFMLVCLFGCEKYVLDQKVRELCAKDGGIKVYETVVLSNDKFDKFGKVHIPSKHDMQPKDEYFSDLTINYYKSGNPRLLRSDFKIIRRVDGKVLGESIRYGRGGGDLPGPWQESSFTCPPISAERPELEAQIFRRQQ